MKCRAESQSHSVIARQQLQKITVLKQTHPALKITLRLNLSSSPRVTAIKTGIVPIGSITAKKKINIANSSCINEYLFIKSVNKTLQLQYSMLVYHGSVRMKKMNIESLVSKAKQVCDNRGARFTPIREKVFRLLASAQGGVGAYDLLEQLKVTETGAKPATIYRALDF